MSQLLIQKLTAAQILRTYGKRFRQIKDRYTNGMDGRCAVGVLRSYNLENTGRDDWSGNFYEQCASIGITVEQFNNIVTMNDLGSTFDEIADWLEANKSESSK